MKLKYILHSTIATTLALGLCQAALANASQYPERPIRLVVALAPGGALDATVRVLAQALSEELKQSVIVENKPGGGSLLGYRYGKSVAPDGYTLLAASSTLVMLPWMRKEPGYDPLTDYIPVSPMVKMPFVLVTSPLVGYKTLSDVFDKSRKDPEAVNYGSAGFGTTTYIAAAKMFKNADLQAVHIPYNGNGAAMADVLAGRVHLLFEQYGVAKPHFAAGKLVPLAVTSTKRSVTAPDIPTLSELGVKGYDYAAWNGLFAPQGTPDEVIQKLNTAMQKVLQKPEIVKRIHSSGDEPLLMNSTAFNTFVKNEYASLGKLIQELGIPKD